jgi:ATP adenylyltransferase
MTKHSRTYDQLKHYLSHEMRMNHVYQPVMLRELLRHKGSASVSDIAKALLAEDRSQLEYYEQITKNMVGRILTSNRGITEKDLEAYHLKNFSHLSKIEINELVKLCNAKIAEYLEKRNDPWSHRRKSTGFVPGTIKFEVVPTANSTLMTIACESADYLGDEGLVQLNLVRRGWLFAATDGAASRNPDPATPA